jgi:hypothetical protein
LTCSIEKLPSVREKRCCTGALSQGRSWKVEPRLNKSVAEASEGASSRKAMQKRRAGLPHAASSNRVKRRGGNVESRRNGRAASPVAT